MPTRPHFLPAQAPAAVLAASLLLHLLSLPAAAEESKVGGAFDSKPRPAAADPIPAEALGAAVDGACPALLDYRVEDIRGRTVNLCAFSGKVLLVVNVASR